MPIKPKELSPKDLELCQLYLREMRRRGATAHEPWELDLETWGSGGKAFPRASTIRRLRLRFADKS